jgi:hypothetical protein
MPGEAFYSLAFCPIRLFDPVVIFRDFNERRVLAGVYLGDLDSAVVKLAVKPRPIFIAVSGLIGRPALAIR